MLHTDLIVKWPISDMKFENEFKKNQILGKHEEKISQGENSPCQIFALVTPLKNQSREVAF